jgi:WD40 repeat protein
VLEGHEAEVVAVSTDGVHIVTGDTSSSLRLWDADMLATTGQLQHSGSSVYCVAVSGDLVVSGSTDSTVKLWRLRARECVATLREHSARVCCVDVGEEAIATGSDDATVRLWPRDGSASRRKLAHPSRLRAVRACKGTCSPPGVGCGRARLCSPPASSCASCGGSVLVSGGSDDRTIKVWSLLKDVNASECATLDKHPSHVRSVAISPSGGFIASAINGEGDADQAKLFVWRPADTKKAR